MGAEKTLLTFSEGLGCAARGLVPSLDIVTSQPFFRSHLVSQRGQLKFHGKIFCRLYILKETKLGPPWESHVQLRSRKFLREACLQKQTTPFIKSIATLEVKSLVGAEDGFRCNSKLQHDLAFRVSQFAAEDTTGMDEREKLRRLKISKANKGNVPWNKGKKHSTETLQKIRERTRIAMQDPKVKMKLANLGHTQSEETRVKIGAGVREGWWRRRERLLVQETCFLEWQDVIADVSRKGYSGDDELQWDSYKILGEQLKKEWLEGIEKRKARTRRKGGKRAPKSPEQRKKISEAISAKWTDPEYRNRVCSALAKYHGIPVGAKRKQRRKMAGNSQYMEQRAMKKKTAEAKDNSIESTTMIKKVIQRKRKISVPLYMDPMVNSKLEMIKKIRGQRAAMEAKRREATKRARLLIAEAEKAATALELAAVKSPLTRASLLEARKLIAEARRSLASIETMQFASQEDDNNLYLNLDGTSACYCSGPQALTGDTSADVRQVNGRPVLSSRNRDGHGSNFSSFTDHNSLDRKKSLSRLESTRISMERDDNIDTISSVSNVVEDTSVVLPLGFDYCAPNGSVRNNTSEVQRPSEAGKTDASVTSLPITKRKWVRGRLVEVEE